MNSGSGSNADSTMKEDILNISRNTRSPVAIGTLVYREVTNSLDRPLGQVDDLSYRDKLEKAVGYCLEPAKDKADACERILAMAEEAMSSGSLNKTSPVTGRPSYRQAQVHDAVYLVDRASGGPEGAEGFFDNILNLESNLGGGLQ